MEEERKERTYRDGVTDVDAPVPIFAFYIAWACLYGYFALRLDDDPEVCLASPDSDVVLVAPSSSSVDVGEIFRYCFDRFFYLTLLQISIALLTHLIKGPTIRQILFLLILLSSYAFIGLWIYLVVIRLEHTGKVCSGDFLPAGHSTDGYLI